jgi:glycolate oxidase iron-sulfur subunit
VNAPTRPTPGIADPLLVEADRCVKCGLCLPACPTYRLAGLEAESPRGRIALIQGLLQGDLPRSDALETHLDNCLACRACEGVCPSGVRYGELIDGVRARLRHPRTAVRQALLAALSRPAVSGIALRLVGVLRLHRAAGLLPQGLGRLLRLAAPVEASAPRLAERTWSPPTRGRVGLFLGCVARTADASVHSASRTLLRALGYAVVEPTGQGCCGAMHRHAGELAAAEGLASAHALAWADAGVQAVLTTATGCGAALRDHGRWLDGADRAPPAVDLLRFLADADWSGPSPRPTPIRAAVHLPCSARDAGLDPSVVLGLLRRIPGVEPILLDPGLGCCGAAGAYLLHHAQNADALRTRTLEAIIGTGASIVLTANTGCAMHLRAGLAGRVPPVRVMHPVELLADAYASAKELDSA